MDLIKMNEVVTEMKYAHRQTSFSHYSFILHCPWQEYIQLIVMSTVVVL